MSWRQRVNSKIYGAGLVISLALAWFFSSPSIKDFSFLALLVVTTALSHYFNITGMSKLVTRSVERRKGLGSGQMLSFLGLKLILLIIGLVCLMVFAPHKVAQGLMLYIFQLIILALSIKNIGKFFKKGSTS